MEDEAAVAKARDIVPGEDLSTMSVEELNRRIAALESEIERVRAEIAAKQTTRSAADAVFKR